MPPLQPFPFSLVTDFLDSSAQMFAQKLFHGAIKLETVLFIRKAVAFIVFYNVGYFDPSGLEGRYHLIRFAFVYTRIVSSLSDQQGNFDLVSVENRRSRRQQILLFLRVPNHLVNHLQIWLPVRWEGFDERE